MTVVTKWPLINRRI